MMEPFRNAVGNGPEVQEACITLRDSGTVGETVGLWVVQAESKFRLFDLRCTIAYSSIGCFFDNTLFFPSTRRNCARFAPIQDGAGTDSGRNRLKHLVYSGTRVLKYA